MVAPSLQNGTSSDSSKAAIAAAVKAASQAALQEKRFQGERANMMVWHCQHTRGDTLHTAAHCFAWEPTKATT